MSWDEKFSLELSLIPELSQNLKENLHLVFGWKLRVSSRKYYAKLIAWLQ
jgi:hypothetical protein